MDTCSRMANAVHNQNPEVERETVLRRKIAAPYAEEIEERDRLIYAFQRGTAQSIRSVTGLSVVPARAETNRFHAAELREKIVPEHLHLLLDGPEGLRACLSLDAELVTAMIQQMTFGSVSPKTAGQRRYTATDAALIAPMCQSITEKAAALCESAGGSDIFSGYAFGAWIEDTEALILHLEAAHMALLEATFDVDGTAKRGSCRLLLPLPSETEAESTADGEGKANRQTLASLAGFMNAELGVVLARVSMPLDDVMNLKPGELLPVSASVDDAQLTSIEGESVANGRLGQINGSRAFRIHATEPLKSTPDNVPADFEGSPAHQRKEREMLETQSDRRADDLIGPMQIEQDIEDKGDIGSMTTDQVADEITQLAGLSDTDEHIESLAIANFQR